MTTTTILRTGALLLLCAAPFADSSHAAPQGPGERAWTGLASGSRTAVIGCERDGILREVLVVEGQRVKQGQVLARLDARVVQAQVDRLRIQAESDARLREAEQRLAQAEREMVRLEKLGSQEIVSPANLQRARVECDVAKIAVEAAIVQQRLARAELAEAEQRLSQYTLRSPFAGTISMIAQRAGDSIERLKPVFQLVDMDPLWVEFDCHMKDIHLLPEGGSVEVQAMHVQGKPRRGVVVHRSVTADPASQTRKVRVAVENPAGGWVPGSKMRLRLAAPPAKPK